MAEEEKGGLEVSPNTEDVVQALMDYLLEPILPVKSSQNDPQNLSLQQSLAKQMHAVVLLYNYFHRKQFPQVEFLDFGSFCKVAVNAKPSLLVHLKHMQKSDGDGPFKNLSVTEEAIMDACNICIGLDAPRDAPNMEGWPISEIAVFLIDSMKENCSLFFSARTEGVWSPIENNVGECGGNSGLGVKNDKNRASRLPISVSNADETRVQQLAMSAIMETTDIDPTEVTILESHVSYSLSKEKTTARFYIMKCKSVKENAFQVPIKDVIESLQGPLVKKICHSYIAADAVEYFHLLPYSGIITDWVSREMLANGSVLPQEVNVNKNFYPRNDEPINIVATGESEGSFGNCQIADSRVLDINNTENLDHKKNGVCYVSRRRSTEEAKSSKFSHPSKERKTTSENLIDDAVTIFSPESNLRSHKSGCAVKEDMLGPVREACNNDMDIDDTQASVHVGPNMGGGPIMVSEQVLVVNDNEYLDCVGPCSPRGTRNVVVSSIEGKRIPTSTNGLIACNVELLKTGITIHGEGDEMDEVILKGFASINFPTDDNPDRPLDSNDKVLLTEAILKVFEAEQTSSLIRRVHACKKWGETGDIRVEILTRRNDMQSRKRQRVSLHDGSSEIIGGTCSGEVGRSSEVIMNDVERVGQSLAINNSVAGSVAGLPLDSLSDVAGESFLQPRQLVSEGVCMQSDFDGGRLDVGLDGTLVVHETCNGQNVHAGGNGTSPVRSDKGVLGHTFLEEDETQNPVVPQSTQEVIVCFSRQYMELYERIVERFGNIIMPESKEATLCSDMVSAAMKGLLEVVDSMFQASRHTVDGGVLESWEMKLRFCEFAGLKVGWLRDHFERVQQACGPFGDAALIQNLEQRATLLVECLEAKRKRAADISNELELIRAEEKYLLDKKVVVDADLEAAQLELGASLF